MLMDNADLAKTVLILALLLVVSAFASSSETAFFSLNRFQLRRIKERYRRSYDLIRHLLARPSRLLIMILVLNELVALAFSSLVTEQLSSRVGGGEAEWYKTTLLSMAITIPILLLVGEMTPKIVAAKMNRVVAMINSRPLSLLYKIGFPFLWLMDKGIGFMLRRLKAEGRDPLSKTMSILSEEDFMLLMEQGHREGTVDQAERKLIKNVFEFDDSTVSEVMTPISTAFMVSANARVSDALPEIRLQKFSRIPVYHRNRRNIVGILYLKDLLALRNHPELAQLDVKSIMTRAMFVGPNMRLSVLFRRFKEAKTHMAVVVNPAAHARLEEHYTRSRAEAPADEAPEEAIGVVTMEDVLESIFGEIADERDVQ
jgi:putative hemolysin